MATQAQKDKAVAAAEKRLGTVTKRHEKLVERVAGYDDLVAKRDEAANLVATAAQELEWAKSRPVSDAPAADEGDEA